MNERLFLYLCHTPSLPATNLQIKDILTYLVIPTPRETPSLPVGFPEEDGRAWAVANMGSYQLLFSTLWQDTLQKQLGKEEFILAQGLRGQSWPWQGMDGKMVAPGLHTRILRQLLCGTNQEAVCQDLGWGLGHNSQNPCQRPNFSICQSCSWCHIKIFLYWNKWHCVYGGKMLTFF